MGADTRLFLRKVLADLIQDGAQKRGIEYHSDTPI